MTSSPSAIPPLPPTLQSMWRLCKLGYRHEPRLMLYAFLLSQLAALPDALLALWLAIVANGILSQRPTLVLAGDADLGVPPPMARAVAAHIPGSRLEIVPESGHSAYWERPDVFNRILLDFFAQHRG